MPSIPTWSIYSFIFYRAMKLKSIKEHSEADLKEFKEIQKRRYEEALENKKREIEESD